MKKTITVGERDIVIRRLKVREIKDFLAYSNGKIDEIFAIADGENLIGDGLSFVVDNFDWLVGFISQLTDISQDEAEDLEAIELLEVIAALLKHNGLDMEKAKAFFTRGLGALTAQEVQEEAAGATMFEEDIPVLPEVIQETEPSA